MMETKAQYVFPAVQPSKTLMFCNIYLLGGMQAIAKKEGYAFWVPKNIQPLRFEF